VGRDTFLLKPGVRELLEKDRTIESNLILPKILGDQDIQTMEGTGLFAALSHDTRTHQRATTELVPNGVAINTQDIRQDHELQVHNAQQVEPIGV
jgi:hypothetical protein